MSNVFSFSAIDSRAAHKKIIKSAFHNCMGKVRDFIRSSPDREVELWPGDSSMFTQINRYRQLSENAGISFALPKGNEPIERPSEHTHSLHAALDSEQHVQERRKLLPEIKGPNVLELGSGSGSVLRLIATECKGIDLLVGVELSPHFFGGAADSLEDIPEEPGKPASIYLVRADITQMYIKPRRFDTVTLASIVHEIKSYYSTEKVRELLQNIRFGLKENGKIIIYDGFRRPKEMAKMTLETAEAKQKFAAYLAASKKPLEHKRDGNVIILPTSDAVEFATKVSFNGWEGEMREEYYPFTLDEYKAMLRESGFGVEKTQTFPEEGSFYPGIKILDAETGADQAASHNNVMLVARQIRNDNRKPI